jgi:multiple sugar transport system permease protein
MTEAVKKRTWWANALLYVGVLLFVLSVLAPMAWLVISSLSSTNDLTTKPLNWLPTQPDFSRYQTLLSFEPNSFSQTFLLALRNSLSASLLATALSLLVGIPAAYSFSRFGQSSLLYGILVTYMLPPVALVFPLYGILASLKLLNTVWGLALVYCTILTPFCTWLLKSNLDSIPQELDEAALIDGANRWVTLWRITLPLALPALSTAALWAILLSWDEFFYALLFTSNQQARTLTVTIADLAAGRAVDFGLICMAGVITALPPVLLGLFLQRGLLSGLTAGSVKG